jgi:hypothetical protein
MKPVLVACLLMLAIPNLVHAGPAPNKASSSALAGTTWRGISSYTGLQIILKFNSPPIVFRQQSNDFSTFDQVGWYNYLSSSRLVAIYFPVYYYLPVTTIFGRIDASGRKMTGVIVEYATAYSFTLTRQ